LGIEERKEPVKKLAKFRVLGAYDPALNPESELVCSLETQEIRGS